MLARTTIELSEDETMENADMPPKLTLERVGVASPVIAAIPSRLVPVMVTSVPLWPCLGVTAVMLPRGHSVKINEDSTKVLSGVTTCKFTRVVALDS